MALFRDRFLAFLVAILLFSRIDNNNFGSFSLLVMADKVDIYSPDLGPDRILLTPQQLSDLAARTNRELKAAIVSHEDSEKISLLKNKLANLDVVQRALQKDIPDFYNRRAEMWQRLAWARSVLHPGGDEEQEQQYLEPPPYSWIAKAGRKYIEDWDAISFSQLITYIADEANERLMDLNRLIIIRNQPARVLRAFLNSLPWHVYIAYHNLSLRIAQYEALLDNIEILPDQDYNYDLLRVEMETRNAKRILESISDDLIRLMRQKENDTLLTKARDPKISEWDYSSDEGRIAMQIDILNDEMTRRFDQWDEIFNVRMSGAEEATIIEVPNLAKVDKSNSSECFQAIHHIEANDEKFQPEETVRKSPSIGKSNSPESFHQATQSREHEFDANEEGENSAEEATIIEVPNLVKVDQSNSSECFQVIHHNDANLEKSPSETVRKSPSIGESNSPESFHQAIQSREHFVESNEEGENWEQQQQSGSSLSKWPNRNFDSESSISRFSSPPIIARLHRSSPSSPSPSSSFPLSNYQMIFFSIITALIAGSIGVGSFSVYRKRYGLHNGNDSVAAFSQNQFEASDKDNFGFGRPNDDSSRAYIISVFVILLLILIAIFLVVWWKKRANGYSLDKVSVKEECTNGKFRTLKNGERRKNASNLATTFMASSAAVLTDGRP